MLQRSRSVTLKTTACIILASGFSSRFGTGNKLLAALDGQPLAAHCAGLVASLPVHTAIGVVPAGDHAVAHVFRTAGIGTIPNPEADKGQGASLALGIRHIEPLPVTAAIVLLADMPFVSAAHINKLADALGGNDAAASRHGNISQPPLIFSRAVFPQLATLTGDKGGKTLLTTLEQVVTVDMSAREATDIDTPDRLMDVSGGD